MIRPAHGTHPLLGRPFAVYDLVRNPEGEAVRVEVVYQVIGVGTEALARLRPGDEVTVWGPLGNGFDLGPGVDQAVIFCRGGDRRHAVPGPRQVVAGARVVWRRPRFPRSDRCLGHPPLRDGLDRFRTRIERLRVGWDQGRTGDRRRVGWSFRLPHRLARPATGARGTTAAGRRLRSARDAGRSGASDLPVRGGLPGLDRKSHGLRLRRLLQLRRADPARWTARQTSGAFVSRGRSSPPKPSPGPQSRADQTLG